MFVEPQNSKRERVRSGGVYVDPVNPPTNPIGLCDPALRYVSY